MGWVVDDNKFSMRNKGKDNGSSNIIYKPKLKAFVTNVKETSCLFDFKV